MVRGHEIDNVNYFIPDSIWVWTRTLVISYTLQLKYSGKRVFYHAQISILKIVFVINTISSKQQKIHVTFSIVIVKILQDFLLQPS